jgi:transposase
VDVLEALSEQSLSLDRLLMDTSNFFTYHQNGGLHRKGLSKVRRSDKSPIGLGLCSAGSVPVLSELFPGNRTDPKVFHPVFEALVTRLDRLEVPTDNLVVVFDRGVNSTENFDDVLGAMHVIAAVNRQEARRLFQTPLSEYHEVGRDGEGKPIRGWSTIWHGYEREWRTLVIYREATAHHPQARWESTKGKVLPQVEKWRASLAKGAPGRSQKAWMRKLVELIPKDCHGVFDYGVERREGKLWPRCSVPAEAEVRGHVFLCVMGLPLYRWLQWKVRDLGLPMKQLVEALEGIRVGAVKTSRGGPQLVVEEMNRTQAQLFSRLKLGDLIPR